MTAFSIALLVCFILVAIPLNILSVWIKPRVNERLPEDQRTSWWYRDYSRVYGLYEEQNPDSILPNLSRYGYYLLLALTAIMILLGLSLRRQPKERET